jgi:hypothetical protein
MPNCLLVETKKLDLGISFRSFSQIETAKFSASALIANSIVPLNSKKLKRICVSEIGEVRKLLGLLFPYGACFSKLYDRN